MEESTTTSASTGGDTSAAPVTTLGDARAALALADSSSAAPATTTEAPSSSTAAATVQPEATDPAQESGQTKAKGEPPAWRWQDLLENARKTSAEEAAARVRQEVEQQYAGLSDFAQLGPTERAGLALWHRALNGDPAARAEVASRAQANPQLAQALQGLIAQPQAPAANAEPEPDLQAPDGTLVFSAPQLKKWQQWNHQQITSQFQKELQPLQAVAQSFQQGQAASAYTTTVASVIASMTAADPVFAEHKADVSKALTADPRLMTLALGDEQTKADPAMALEIAWNRVYRSKVLPATQKQSEAQVLTTLQQRAVAATTNPATATSATPRSTLGDARASLEHASAQLGG
jgi:hypothetical protein